MVGGKYIDATFFFRISSYKNKVEPSIQVFSSHYKMYFKLPVLAQYFRKHLLEFWLVIVDAVVLKLKLVLKVDSKFVMVFFKRFH